jgi:hypothetical protein
MMGDKRSGDGAKPRMERVVRVMHSEAFQLMMYVAKDGSDPIWFWNSRDGVTPFGTTIDGVEYTHAMNRYRAIWSAVLPDQAQRVWVDASPEVWRGWLHKRWERFRDAPASEWHDPAEFLGRYPTPEAFEAVEPYWPGEPRSITRAEFLETTQSWQGRVGE